MLLKYPWPGNIRELGAVIDRAAILGNGQSLEVAEALGTQHARPVPAADFAAPTLYEVMPDPPVAAQPESQSAVSTLDAAMRAHIQKALLATRGRIEGRGGTAALLGINPHTLRARMRKLRLIWSQYRS